MVLCSFGHPFVSERRIQSFLSPSRLFCIVDFRSSEVVQDRAFATSAASKRMTKSFGSSALRKTLPFVMPAEARLFSCASYSGRHTSWSFTLWWISISAIAAFLAACCSPDNPIIHQRSPSLRSFERNCHVHPQEQRLS